MTKIRVRMAARDTDEPHRASTPLELFFDLVFVIAVAQASAGLHHGLDEGHASSVLVAYPLIFFAIWWAWMNFTWFASAYDTDDVPYRLAVFVIMVGVLVLAAGIPRVYSGESYGIITAGYVIMRLAMVGLWLRVAAASPDDRPTASRYAIGIAVLQVLWVARLALPGAALVSFLVLVVAEMAVPIWAERTGSTSWHPGHIAERYGLFTIIVLGESLLAATNGVQSALDADAGFAELAPTIVGGLLIVFSMWWLYFDIPLHRVVSSARAQYEGSGKGIFAWGYGHYFVFASVAATGAGLAVVVDHVVEHIELSSIAAALALTIPVALYLLAVLVLHAQHVLPYPAKRWGIPVTAALVIAASFTPQPALATGLLLAALVAVVVIGQRESELRHTPT